MKHMCQWFLLITARKSLIQLKQKAVQPSFLFQAHPDKPKETCTLFSSGVIRLGLKSPAGRLVYDWRRPVPSACHSLTCLTASPDRFIKWHFLQLGFKKWGLCFVKDQGLGGGPGCWFKPKLCCFDKFLICAVLKSDTFFFAAPLACTLCRQPCCCFRNPNKSFPNRAGYDKGNVGQLHMWNTAFFLVIFFLSLLLLQYYLKTKYLVE